MIDTAAAHAPPESPDILVLEGIAKAFPGVQALDGATLRVKAGEIHGLIGENGAGKSTLIKVLAGIYQPDAGRLVIDGGEVAAGSPEAIHAAGIRFIHQELNLVPHFTVAETIFLGQELVGPLGLRTRAMRRAAERFLKDRLGADIAGNKLIADLGIAERKLVQIARALIDGKARVVVFDEPTAPLTHAEIDHLFAAIEALSRLGIAMVYVSHYLAEITRICDRVTVLRNGRNAGLLETVSSEDTGRLISLMVGREIGNLYPKHDHVPGAPWLTVEGLSLSPHYDDVTFDVRSGEIVGLAGLVGSGSRSADRQSRRASSSLPWQHCHRRPSGSAWIGRRRGASRSGAGAPRSSYRRSGAGPKRRRQHQSGLARRRHNAWLCPARRGGKART